MYTVHSPFFEPARLLGVQFTKSFDLKVTRRRSKAVTACWPGVWQFLKNPGRVWYVLASLKRNNQTQVLKIDYVMHDLWAHHMHEVSPVFRQLHDRVMTLTTGLGTVFVTWHLMATYPGCPRQQEHTDNPGLAKSGVYQTVIIPLTCDPVEAGGTLFDQTLVNPYGGMCVFGGDVPHAGEANRTQDHVRVFLFAVISSSRYDTNNG